jgi:hypothetical protein
MRPMSQARCTSRATKTTNAALDDHSAHERIIARSLAIHEPVAMSCALSLQFNITDAAYQYGGTVQATVQSEPSASWYDIMPHNVAIMARQYHLGCRSHEAGTGEKAPAFGHHMGHFRCGEVITTPVMMRLHGAIAHASCVIDNDYIAMGSRLNESVFGVTSIMSFTDMVNGIDQYCRDHTYTVGQQHVSLRVADRDHDHDPFVRSAALAAFLASRTPDAAGDQTQFTRSLANDGVHGYFIRSCIDGDGDLNFRQPGLITEDRVARLAFQVAPIACKPRYDGGSRFRTSGSMRAFESMEMVGFDVAGMEAGCYDPLLWAMGKRIWYSANSAQSHIANTISRWSRSGFRFHGMNPRKILSKTSPLWGMVASLPERQRSLFTTSMLIHGAGFFAAPSGCMRITSDFPDMLCDHRLGDVNHITEPWIDIFNTPAPLKLGVSKEPISPFSAAPGGQYTFPDRSSVQAKR